jgi:pantoate--beta-alanine ligase
MNLTKIKNDLQAGSLTSLKEKAKLNLEKTGFRVDYIELADANDLRIVKDWDGDQKLVALVAAFLNDIRLIDNIQLN